MITDHETTATLEPPVRVQRPLPFILRVRDLDANSDELVEARGYRAAQTIDRPDPE